MKCSICGREIKGMGNNAAPFCRGRCCDDLEVEDKKTIYFVGVIMDIGQKKNGLILSKRRKIK